MVRRIADAFHVEEPTFTDIDNLVNALDVNGDGKITQAEFETLIQEIVVIISEVRQSSK